MREYEDLNLMPLVPISEATARYYIPLQPVIKVSRTTTKPVVYDASSKAQPQQYYTNCTKTATGDFRHTCTLEASQNIIYSDRKLVPSD